MHGSEAARTYESAALFPRTMDDSGEEKDTLAERLKNLREPNAKILRSLADEDSDGADEVEQAYDRAGASNGDNDQALLEQALLCGLGEVEDGLTRLLELRAESSESGDES